jgi:GAF domain-containing protein
MADPGSASMSESGSMSKRLARLLYLPHPAVTGEQTRRQAQVSSLFLLGSMAFLGGVLLVAWLMRETLLPGLLVLVLVVACYGISRTSFPGIANGLLVAGLTIANVVMQISFHDPGITARTLPMFLLPVVLAALTLPLWAAHLATTTNLVFPLFLVLFAPWVDLRQTFPSILIVLAIGLAIAVTKSVRERDIRQLESQSKEIATYSRRLETDIQRIMTTAEVGQRIATTRDLDRLLNEVVNLIVERFDFYHAQVFLLDEAGQNAVLLASTGEVGRKLLERGHTLPVGSQSVIGEVTATLRAVVARDTDVDPVHRRNELLPDTRSEIALPLQVGGRLIGALDIQSERPDAFEDTDLAVFQTMADQLAIAIENANLFDHAQRDLREIEALNRQLTGAAWREYVASREKRAPVGYHADARGVRAIAPEESPPGTKDVAISLPLTVRGEKIGVLDLAPRGQQPRLDSEVQSMLEAVAERVALALDSSRLGERAQRQAAREQMLGQLSVRLQASTDIDTILQVAATEASQAASAEKGFIQLVTSEQDPADTPPV